MLFLQAINQTRTKSIVLNGLQIAEINITEHIEGDETKLALWTGRAPISDYRIILKVRASYRNNDQIFITTKGVY